MLIFSSSTLFPRFWEGFLISGIADVKPEVCLESVCSMLASAIIRLKQAISSIRPVTVYFYIDKTESSIKIKDVWRCLRTVGGMYSPSFVSN